MKSNVAGYLVADVDPEKCSSCGLCCKVCPSVAANQVVTEGGDTFHGMCLNAYIGHSTNSEIRQKSQSGGVVTALLCYLLEQRLIEGAIVNRFNEHTKRPEVACLQAKDELLSAAGSYYSQSSVVKTVLDNRDKQTAAVVLGCQSQSLKLIEQACPEIDTPAYKIGLICSGQHSGKFIDDLIAVAGATNKKIIRLRFKDKDAGGWPGNVKIYTSDQSYELNRRVRWRLGPVYEVYRCLMCFDQMNVHSDIVAGDPWGIDNDDNKKGNTVIIARTKKGQRLIDNAAKQGYIKVSDLPVDDVMKGQTVDTRLKTLFFTAVALSKQKGRLLPIDENGFKGIKHVQPTITELRRISERLEYSRTACLECSNQRYGQMIRSKKKKLTRKRRMYWPMHMGKKVLRKSLRWMRPK